MNSKMIENWLVDLSNLTCRNIETQIVIVFEKRGRALEAKIKDIPAHLMEKWAMDPNCNKYIRKTVFEADKVFFKVYFDEEIKRKSICTVV
jgi:hypothetical protein